MNFITKKSLERRTFLKGAGTALALPFLDAMAPALTAQVKSIPRVGFVYVSHGVIWDDWKPKTVGPDFELTTNLQPLAKLKGQFNILSGLSHLEADTKGDGSGDHTRASAAWLTGVHAYDRTRPGVEMKLATTADQIIARELGKNSPLPSLEPTTDTPSQGSCDAGDCFYVNTVSWRNETTPNMTENHPRVVFERLFGDGGNGAQRLAQAKATGSILDSVSAEAAKLAKSLGRTDRTKLSEYMESIREIETRIQNTEKQGAQSIELPDRPLGIPDNFDDHTKLMFDLQVLAFQTDMTRVFTFIMARELSLRPYPFIGVPDAHHSVSHHRDDADLMAKKSLIDTHHVLMLSYLLEKMAATPDGDGSLLDHSLIVYGSGMGNGNLHRHSDMPVLLAGQLGGKVKTGIHYAYKQDTPMANLLLSIMDKTGVKIDQFGDSTGRLQPDPIVLG
jgi:hypothetical protein